MIFEQEWKAEMFANIKTIRPHVSDDMIWSVVNDHYKKNFTDHDVSIYNSYEETIQDTKLSLIPDIIEQNNLIVTASGVLFHSPGEGVERNLIAEVQAHQLDRRKVLKKEMFEAEKRGDMILAKNRDSGQQSVKKQANSGFGITNNPFSFLYGFNSSSSITATGRAKTSLSSQVYEATLGDTVKFFNTDEMMYFVNTIRGEKKENIFHLDEIINIYPSKEAVVGRLLYMYHDDVDVYNKPHIIEIVESVVDGLSKEERTRVYYKNNMREFVKNDFMKTLLFHLICDIKGFEDPNEIPEAFAPQITLWNELIMEFVLWAYIPTRFEDRARYETRKVVPLMDTDSNVIYYGQLYDDIMNIVFDVRFIGNQSINDRTMINLLSLLSNAASRANEIVISNFLDVSNAVKKERHRVKMKNEFFFPMLIITTAKKSYYASVARKEALIYDSLKLDVKGVTFFKSSATPKTSQFIYDKILFKELLDPKDGKINVIRIMRKIEKYKMTMIKEIKDGDISYYKKAKVKTREAYDDPMSIQQYKAAWVWNSIMPESEQIELPGHCYIVKINLNKREDLAMLEEYPEIYEKLSAMFDDHINIGGGKVWDAKKGKEVNKKGKGITSIGVPLSYEEVPEWLVPILDVSGIVANNMSLFKPIYTPLGGQVMKTSSKNGGSKYYTPNIKVAM